MADDLKAWEQKLSESAAELDQLQATRDRLVAELGQLEEAAAADLATVAPSKLAAAAEKQAAARSRVDGITLAIAELDRRIGVATEHHRRTLASTNARRVEAEQGRVDDLARVALARLQAAVDALEEVRAAETGIYDRYNTWPNVRFPSSLIDALKHRIEFATKELS